MYSVWFCACLSCESRSGPRVLVLKGPMKTIELIKRYSNKNGQVFLIKKKNSKSIFCKYYECFFATQSILPTSKKIIEFIARWEKTKVWYICFTSNVHLRYRTWDFSHYEITSISALVTEKYLKDIGIFLFSSHFHLSMPFFDLFQTTYFHNKNKSE